MSKMQNLLAGLGGAIALNILHESLKRLDKDMPRIDLVGEEALQKTLNKFDTEIKDDKKLYAATLVSDLISNALYYSTIAAGDAKYIWPRAITVGIAAGVGAITLPEPLGLNDEPVTRTNKTKALTIGYYLAGALITGCIVQAMKRKQ